MLRRLMMVAWLLSCAGLLTACQTNPYAMKPYKPVTKVEIHTPHVPDALLNCRKNPGKPSAKGTQRDVARYVIQLHAAGNDCRYKLGKVGEIVHNFELVMGTR